MEGCSNRYRYLHNRALTVARAISLHLIDAPGQGTDDNDPLTEVKRRVWWHIASTDWLLSTMGGPRDRTYQVSPRHMLVNFPRNLNVKDESNAQAANTPTDMTYFILRTRLAEVCRQVVDSLPLGGCDIDGLPYEQVSAISQLFSDAMASMPPDFALDAPMRPDSPPDIVVNRQIIHLAFHARIARIFRPFLLVPDTPQPGRDFDPRCSQYRSICLRSARSVLVTASNLLRESLDESAVRLWPLPLMHRSGCVISHTFMACVVLGTDPKLAPAGTTGAGCDSADAQAIRRELAEARRLLERVGERSPMAASLVGKLVGVLKRHALHAAGEHHQPEAGSSATTTDCLSTDTQGQAVPSGSVTATPNTDGTAVEPHNGWAEQQPSYIENSQHGQTSDAGAMKDINWELDDGVGEFNTQMLDGIEWAALMGVGLADANSWGDLFADLDAAFPASM
ncbi:hypothetical protein NKR19_g5203 [Coniochaeta hoffmannii]|uniref:Transcription factor domain-containing protein n=1 Tax=Coniochaeta hoffmannii TaxID=91930 RepID=A0AA38S4P6_9PEZI|nr:hypothetical protein NKR19_g5203 [Coniochaeta hoffmannii]